MYLNPICNGGGGGGGGCSWSTSIYTRPTAISTPHKGQNKLKCSVKIFVTILKTSLGVSLIVIMYFLKNADIIFVFSLVDNNLINMCAKYNVYIMFLTLILIGGAPGAPPPPPGYYTLSNSPVQIGLKDTRTEQDR